MFPHTEIHKGTWRSPDGQHLNQINQVDIESDHFLVVGKLRIKLKGNQGTKKERATERFDIVYLNNPVVVEKFQKGLDKKLRVMQANEPGREVKQIWK